jgi:hypothetical protein
MAGPVPMQPASLAEARDSDLLRSLNTLVARDRQEEADLLAVLAEVDVRELYLAEGYPSMFAYCTEALHFSEATAFDRIRAARAARDHPVLLDRIRSGEIHLSGVRLLAPWLTPGNHVELLDLARHKSKRAIEELLADRNPKPEVPASVRRLPAQVPPARPLPPLEAPPAGPDAICAAALKAVPRWRTASGARTPAARNLEPLGLGRFKVQFTASRGLRDKLREAQALLRHQVPDGDVAEIFERALTLLVEEARRRKFAQVGQPRGKPSGNQTEGSRHISAAIRREVVARDEGRCAYVAPSGRRCGSRDFLEFHHKEPWARSKRHSVAGIELRCRAHNHHAAVQDFGAEYMRQRRKRQSTPTRPGTSPNGPEGDSNGDS